MTGKYILVGQTPVPCRNLLRWAKWFEGAERIVKQTAVGPFFVSTVFMGIDHNFSRQGEPILFETMIFSRAGQSDFGQVNHDAVADDDEPVGRMWRYRTWLEAEQHHDTVVSDLEQQYGIMREAATETNLRIHI